MKDGEDHLLFIKFEKKKKHYMFNLKTSYKGDGRDSFWDGRNIDINICPEIYSCEIKSQTSDSMSFSRKICNIMDIFNTNQNVAMIS